MDLIQSDDYPADSCASSPTVFLLDSSFKFKLKFLRTLYYFKGKFDA